MGRIATYYNQGMKSVGPPRRAGTAPAQHPAYGSMTRQRRAMAGFGAGLMSFGIRMADIATEQLVHSEFVKGKALWEQKNNEFFESLREDPDYLAYPEKYKKYTEQTQKEILAGIKTPGAQNSLKNYIIDDGPANIKILKGVMGEKLRDEELRNLSEAVQSFIPEVGADLEVLEQGIIKAEVAAQGALQKGYLTANQAEEWIIQELMEDWPEVAAEKIEVSKLDPQRKRQLQSQASAVIRNKGIEQRRVQQEVWDKTEGEAFNLWFDNKLTPEWIREQFNLGNLSATDRDGYLSVLLRPKEVALNWEVYDKLSEMVEDYDKEKVTKDEVRLAITKALGKDIPETVAVRLRGKLDTIDEPDNPMNRASAKRAMDILAEMKVADFFWPEGVEEDDIEGKRQNLLRYLELTKELEQWITANPDATDEQINDKVDTITKPAAEDVVLNWFERLMWTERRQLFGLVGTQAERLAKKKAKAKAGEEEKSPYPEYPDAFLEGGIWKVIKNGKKYRIE